MEFKPTPTARLLAALPRVMGMVIVVCIVVIFLEKHLPFIAPIAPLIGPIVVMGFGVAWSLYVIRGPAPVVLTIDEKGIFYRPEGSEPLPWERIVAVRMGTQKGAKGRTTASLFVWFREAGDAAQRIPTEQTEVQETDPQLAIPFAYGGIPIVLLDPPLDAAISYIRQMHSERCFEP